MRANSIPTSRVTIALTPSLFIGLFIFSAAVAKGQAAHGGEDFSQLGLGASANVELLLTDPQGKRTGFDAKTKSDLEEVPQSSYTRDALQDDKTGAPVSEGAEFLNVAQPAEGLYHIQVLGLERGIYHISFDAFSQDQRRQPRQVLKGVTAPGSASFFQIDFKSRPGAVSTITRVATFDSTLEDISNSQTLRLVKTTALASSLTNQIKAASGAKARGDSTAAKETLNAFKTEVQSEKGKHIDPLPAHVLTEDADSLLSQLP